MNTTNTPNTIITNTPNRVSQSVSALVLVLGLALMLHNEQADPKT
jgi:hypothetical protein